jgi:hypothetical protein
MRQYNEINDAELVIAYRDWLRNLSWFKRSFKEWVKEKREWEEKRNQEMLEEFYGWNDFQRIHRGE